MTQEQHDLIVQMRPLALSIAREVFAHHAGKVEADELRGEAMLSLVRHVLKTSSSKNLSKRVRWDLTDYIRQGYVRSRGVQKMTFCAVTESTRVAKANECPVAVMVSVLLPRWQRVILPWLNGESQRDIAKAEKVCETRISHIIAESLERLRSCESSNSSRSASRSAMP